MTNFILASLLLMLFPYVRASFLQFNCDLSGTVTLTNPNSSRWNKVLAHDRGGSRCTVTSPDDMATVLVTFCDLNSPIDVLFLDSKAAKSGRKGRSRQRYNIFCPYFYEVLINRVDPSEAKFVDVVAEEVRYQGTVGEQLKLKLTPPTFHNVLPLNCTSSPGPCTSFYNLLVIKDLIRDGCTMDPSLISDFRPVEDKGKLVADFNIFKFKGHKEICINCLVRVCSRGSGNCTFTCTNGIGVNRPQIPYNDMSFEGTLSTGLAVMEPSDWLPLRTQTNGNKGTSGVWTSFVPITFIVNIVIVYVTFCHQR